MSRYYVNINPQSNGDHEVHKAGCSHFPNSKNAKSIGFHDSCHEAVREAKKNHYVKSDGCAYCSPACHTS